MIRSQEYCDICEVIHGEASEESKIGKEIGRPAFPQITWTYFKKGLQILTGESGKKHLQENWLGSVTRLELCVTHSNHFNILLKGFCSSDSRITKLLDEMKVEDDVKWAAKQENVRAEFETLTKEKEV